jgi:hypothetical protein
MTDIIHTLRNTIKLCAVPLAFTAQALTALITACQLIVESSVGAIRVKMSQKNVAVTVQLLSCR